MSSGRIYNEATLCGVLEGEFEFHYSRGKLNCYINYVIIERKHKGDERIPIVVKEKQIDFSKKYTGQKVYIFGKVKEKGYYNDRMLYVLVDKMGVREEKLNIMNTCTIRCKLGEKQKVEQYESGAEKIEFDAQLPTGTIIGCVAWNRKARYISKIDAKCDVKLKGRITTEYFSEGKVKNRLEVTDARIL